MHSDVLTTLEFLAGEVVIPVSIRKIDITGGGAGLQNRSHQQSASHHELIVDVQRIVIILILQNQRTEPRQTSLMRLREHGVKVGHQMIAELNILAHYVFISFSEPPRLLIVIVDRMMVSKEGREKTNLIPSCKQLTIASVHIAAAIRADKSLTAQSERFEHRNAQSKRTPGAWTVARPHGGIT